MSAYLIEKPSGSINAPEKIKTMHHKQVKICTAMRAFAVTTLLAFVWTFVAAPAAIAATAKPASKPAAPHLDLPVALKRAKQFEGKKYPTFDYAGAEAKQAQHPIVRRNDLNLPRTLLVDVPILSHKITPEQLQGWKTALRTGKASQEDAAWDHVWLGEWELAQNQQPEIAAWHFGEAKKLSSSTERVYGLATYDEAIASYAEGAYSEALHKLKPLATLQPTLTGYDPKRAISWMRHASACVGYHAQRSRAGIPEPPRLDPLCAVSALATCLKAIGRPYDKQTLLKACRVTGEGSNLQDVFDAAKKLGVQADAVSADDEGLISLPKPLVAYVEHDHFVAVTQADEAGVTYLCSDCGLWPGGTVHLTWNQWHMMEASLFTAISIPGSPNAARISTIPLDPADPAARSKTPVAPLHRVAMNGPLSGLLHDSEKIATPAHPLIKGRVFRRHAVQYHPCIGLPFTALCVMIQLCPKDGTIVPDCGDKGGASDGDPVNLGNGAEEYTPSADLTVSNPHGPFVKWERMYNSLRNWGAGYAEGDPTYECNDFGNGWSQGYNKGVFMSGDGHLYIFMPDGSRIPISSTTSVASPSTAPSAGHPIIACSIQPDFGMAVEWDYDASSNSDYFVITNSDHSKWITTAIRPGISCYQVAEIRNSVGQSIYCNYTPADTASGWPLLASITTGQSGTGTALLSVQRATDGTNSITSITDCYGRSVYYNVQTYPDVIGSQHLDHVSQIVPSCTPNPPDRYVLGYQFVNFTATNTLCTFLHTITVPSATGTGTATATIYYEPQTANVASRKDANGNSRIYDSVDAHGNIVDFSSETQVSLTDHLGHSSILYSTGYDLFMDKAFVLDANRKTVASFGYADPGNGFKPSYVEDAYFIDTQFTYDSMDNCTSIILNGSRGVIGGPAVARRPRNFRPRPALDPLPAGGKKIFTYDYSADPRGVLTKTQLGLRSPVTMNMDPVTLGLHSISIPKPGTVGSTLTSDSQITIDTAGNPIVVTTPDSTGTSTYTTTINYTTDGSYSRAEGLNQPVTVTSTSGKVTHYRYDEQNRVSQVIDPTGLETDFTYNIADQPTVIMFPATGQTGSGHSTVVYTYLYPGGPCSHSTLYDENGVMTRDVAYGYDHEGVTTSVTSGGVTSTIVYDGQYRPVTVTDGNGHTTTYTYDNVGNLSSIAHPGAGTGAADKVQYPSYDLNGNVLVKIDGRGVETDYTYDILQRLTDITYPASTSSNIHYTYDDIGHVTTETDASAGRSFTYDDNGSLLTVTTTYPGLPSSARTFTISYAYNPDGSRHSMTTPAGTFTYVYDANGRPQSVTNTQGQTTSWAYADNDWLQAQTLGNGVTTSYVRNGNGLLTDLVTRKSDNTLLSNYSGMSYDAAGNQLSMTASIPAATSFSGITSYSYDNRDQLTQETSARNGGYTNTFAYDNNGNATTMRGTTASYDADDQKSGTTYDGSGNPATYNGQSLSFDAIGNVTTIGTALTAGYFAGGRRAFKTAATGTTYYLYDGSKPVCEIDGTGAVTAVNTWGVAGLVSRTTGAGSAFYTFDPQGSVSQKLDATGAPVASSMFDAYGASATSDPDPYNAPGAEYGNYKDAETGLIWMGHRYYDPAGGRFITRDPIGKAGGSNEYAYTGNNPVTRYDASGLAYSGNSSSAPALSPSEQGKMALAAFVSAVTDGNYDGGKYRCDPDWGLMTAIMGYVWGLVGSDGFGEVGELGETGTLLEDGELGGGGCPLLCLTAGTAVQMADGTTKPIEQVHPGDYVLARDQQTGSLDQKRVSATISRKAPVLVMITLEDIKTGQTATYTATPEHPFYVDGKGWLTAGTLAKGTAIATRSGQALIVKSVQWQRDEEKGFSVYNMTVEDDHDYLAGTLGGGVWVHNACGGRKGTSRTRLQNVSIVSAYMDDGWILQHGGGILPEEFIPGPGGGTIGSAYPDITLTKGDIVMRINTVTTTADGLPTFTEMYNAEKITSVFPNDILILIPKW